MLGCELILLFWSLFSGVSISLLTMISMKKFCKIQIPNQIVITLLIISVISSFFSIIHSSVPTIAFRMIILLAFMCASAFISVKNKKFPDIILIYAIVLRVIIAVIDVVSFKEQFTEIVIHDMMGLILGSGVLFLINKICEKLSDKPIFSLYEIKVIALMGLFTGYVCTYSSLMLAFVFLLFMKLLARKKLGKNINLSLQPFILCGYLISMIMCVA